MGRQLKSEKVSKVESSKLSKSKSTKTEKTKKSKDVKSKKTKSSKLPLPPKSPKVPKSLPKSPKDEKSPKSKSTTEVCPSNQPASRSRGCTLSESIECKYGEETCCPNGGAEKTFASLIARCFNGKWIFSSTEACFNPDSECKGKTE